MANVSLQVVWFKRDLRIEDHAPLLAACAAGTVLPVFTWSPAVWRAEDASATQARFVRECLQSLAEALHGIGLHLHVYHLDPVKLLQRLHEKYRVAALYSHEETGNALTYQQDLAVQAWCRQHGVAWQEWPQHGVVRRLSSRDQWHAHWLQRMQQPCLSRPRHAQGIQINHHGLARLPGTAGEDKPARQYGGIVLAEATMQDFLRHRVAMYRGGISSPLKAVSACSRLSPYLAWGAVSLRTLVHASRAVSHSAPTLRRHLHAFESRLHWHCHFIQKLETEPRIEFESFYRGFDRLRRPADAHASLHLMAWQAGETGWPLVDACMAMLRHSGWLNFRMRAMLMSTASYLLWLPWRSAGLHLAREFIDYEPGIHWSQVQMQSGTTGINTLRIYDPVKQALEQDPQGDFVRQWIPALRSVPNSWIFEPWRMPANLQRKYGCIIGQHYPAPLVEIPTAIRHARQQLGVVRAELQQNGAIRHILHQHASRKSAHFPPRQASVGQAHATPVNAPDRTAEVPPVQGSLPF